MDGTGGVHLEEHAITLPNSGEVQLAIIRVRNQVTDSMDYLESAVRNVEEFMGVPLPTNYVALYVGQYYWKGDSNQWWLSEGAADMVSYISENVRIERPLEPDRRPCPYFETISQLESANPALGSPEFSCWYSLSQRLFLDLHDALGDADFRQGFRNLYLSAERDRLGPLAGAREDDRQGIRHLAAAFKTNLSDAAAAKVGEVILRRYGDIATGGIATHEGDRAELIKFYHATGGSNWTNSANWLSDAHIDNWHGVVTDDDGRVIELDLGDNGLSGELPPGLTNLAKLEELLLSDNRLRGSIPPEIGNLTRLTQLELDDNELTGEIPT